MVWKDEAMNEDIGILEFPKFRPLRIISIGQNNIDPSPHGQRYRNRTPRMFITRPQISFNIAGVQDKTVESYFHIPNATMWVVD